MSFTRIASSTDREAWLEARRDGVTATDVARLVRGGPKTWATIQAEKDGVESWGGNRYTRWGADREPVIVKHLKDVYSFEANADVLQKDGTPWLATPDALGFGMTGEAKAKKWKGEKLSVPEPDHVDQVLWQLWVTDFDLGLIAYEYYSETDHGLRPAFFEPPQVFEVARDEERIAELVETAQRFLQEGPPTGLDRLLAELAAKVEIVSFARSAWESARAEADEIKALAAKEAEAHHSGQYSNRFASIKVSHPKPATRFDQTAFKQEHPDLAEAYMKTSEKAPEPRVSVKFEEEAA